jgi:hypothetical protein
LLRFIDFLRRFAALAVIVIALSGCSQTTSDDLIQTQTVPATQTRPEAAPTTPLPTSLSFTETPSSEGDCTQVERILPDSAEAQAIGQDLIATNPRLAGMETPPLFAEIRSIDRLGEWILFQASFESHLEPAIFVLQKTPTGYRYVTLWGGQAQDAAEIRSALAAEEASLPPSLLACLQPAEWFLPAPVAPTVKTPSLTPTLTETDNDDTPTDSTSAPTATEP